MSTPAHDLELVSFPTCPFVHRVTTLLHEKQVPFRVRYIDLRNKPDWFLALSPKGRVPVLVADGRSLYESAALLEFVDETHAPRLLPEDPFERARQRAFVSFGGDLFAAQYRLFTARTEADHAAAQQALRGQLDTFEAVLGSGPFFAGSQFGLVDTAVAPALQRMVFLEQRGIDVMGDLPRVKAWAHVLAARPSVVAGMAPDFERQLYEWLRAGGSVIGQRLGA